jgi:PAS domain S-box-containing protein
VAGLALTYRIAISVALVAAAVLAQWYFVDLPDFVLLMPAVLVAAFLGGRWAGVAALAATTAFAAYSLAGRHNGLHGGDLFGLACFVAGGLLAVGLVDLHDKAAARLGLERNRLQAALRAADAASWEISPEGKLSWDENFYRLVGLDPQKEPPSTETFLAMVHPDDRARMAEARRLMDLGGEPRQSDEYRLIRPDGTTIWLENHRTRESNGGDYYLGITQDITRRKRAEERVGSLLREAAHRARNQFTVIIAVARETSRASPNPEAFEDAFTTRLMGLAASHDLLVTGEWTGARLRELLLVHLEPFGVGERVVVAGPDLTISASAAQHLGMAFHELATNAVKHGSLSSPEGVVNVTWETADGPSLPEFRLTWSENGGPPPGASMTAGFGTQVLTRLVPGALEGEARRDLLPSGLKWSLVAPLSAIAAVSVGWEA